MNRTYALIWNHALGAWTVANEHARRRGKGAGAVLAAALLLPAMASAADLPSGGNIAAGSGQISTPNANQLVIDQASNKLAINWQSFDIAAGNTVTFNQPGTDSIALNRVLGADGSKIMGQLDANGRVFIINPNGVLFGQGAQVNVGGLVASTLDISNADFEAGNYSFKGDGSNASVINNGTITAADGGAVALLGGTVSNNGVIVANQGSVALAAGNKVTLDFAGDGLLNVQVDEAVVDALVENHKLIKADGGQVLLTADAGESLLKTVVNNTGVIEAQTLGEKNGKIVLLGGFDGGTVQVAGTLDASAPNGGDGGFIETSGAHVKVADSAKVTTKAANGKTGKWLIDPNDFTVAATGGDMTGAAVSAAVQNNNFEIQTATQGTAGGNGDIHINDAITWSSGNTLTFNAERNINVNAAITATGASAGVALNYGGTNGSSSATPASGSDYHVNAPVTLSGSGANLSINGNTYTLIHSMTQLDAIDSIGQSGRYALAQDLDASGATYGQALVDYFDGTFAGLGHTLSNLTIVSTAMNVNVGLFGRTGSSSTIRDVGLNDITVSGTSFGASTNSGGLVGWNAGSINNAYATGSVTGNSYGGGTQTGGLVGWNEGAISGSYATVSVTGNGSGGGTESGGLVGWNSGSVSNTYATGNVTGNGSGGGTTSGALVGQNSGSVSNAYATGHVTNNGHGGSNDSGGLVGWNSGNVSNAYWDTSSTGQAQGVNSGATTSVDISTRYNHSAYASFGTWTLVSGTSNVYAALDSNGVAQWIMIEGQTRPFLASEYSTSIGNAHQLQLMAYNLGANYTLARDIDVSATAGSNASGMWSTAGFDPIGNSSNAFSGSLDGQSHTISGLTINRSNTNNVGLLGYTGSSSLIRNIGSLGSSVTGNNLVGGLVGQSWGSISNAYTTGSVTGNDSVGGLVGGSISAGLNSGTSISNAYATGSVTGNSYVGGLVGNNNNTISNAYATGSVTGNSYVGGLVGGGDGSISNTYATGSITGTTYVGGLVGLLLGNIGNSFWNSGSSGVSVGVGSGLNSGVTDKTSAELRQASTFSGWDIASTSGTNAVWRIYEGQSGPLLRSFLKSVTVTVSDVAGKTYDGTSGTVAGISHSFSDSSASLQGSASYTSVSTLNANTYGLGLSGLYSDQQGYDISVVEGSYVIAKADLILSGTKTYDGTPTVSGSTLVATGVNGETFSLSGSGDASNLASKNVQSGSVLSTTTGLSLGSSSNGGLSSNYNVISTTGSSYTVTAKGITLSGITAADKVYDATTAATLNTSNVSYSGLITGDSVTLSGTGSGAFDYKDVGIDRTVTVTGYTISGDDAGNYVVLQPSGLTATISKADLLVSGISAADKTYNGTRAATLSGTASVTALLSDVVSVSGTGTGTFVDKNAGPGKDVTVTGYTLSGTDADNYNVVQPTNLTASITKANISAVTGITGSNKTYDGTLTASLNTGNASFTGMVTGDDLSIGSATGSLRDKNVGTGKAVDITGITLGGDDAGNYNLLSNTATTAANVSAAAVTIIADDASKVAGQSIVPNGYTSSGLVTGESITSVSLSSAGAPSSAAAGTYAIVASDAIGAIGTAVSNYVITYVNGSLLVSAAPSEAPLLSSSQPYIGMLASNGQTLSSETKQQANEPEALTPDMLVTNPLDERLNLQVINNGIRLPEGI